MIGKLELLVGPIASGKSTYCKQAAMDGKIIVNDDSIVNAIHAGQYRLYNKELKPLYKSIENHIVQIALMLGKTVVIDRPNYSMKMRARYIAMAKSVDAEATIVMFKREENFVHARRRTESDCRGYPFQYWLAAVERHQSLYEEPNKELERFDNIINWEYPNESATS